VVDPTRTPTDWTAGILACNAVVSAKNDRTTLRDGVAFRACRQDACVQSIGFTQSHTPSGGRQNFGFLLAFVIARTHTQTDQHIVTAYCKMA
jgi:hypothetical protein